MLRDKFAMAAMQGLMSEAILFGWSTNEISEKAYEQADSMMRERKRYNFANDPDNEGGHLNGYSTAKPEKRPVPPEIETPPIKIGY